MDASGAHLLPEGLPQPELSPEVRARLAAYRGRHGQHLDPVLVAALRRLVEATGPETLTVLESTLGLVFGLARFADATPATPVAGWFTRATVDRWKSSYRTLGVSWARVKNGAPVLGRIADLLVGLSPTILPRGPRPHNTPLSHEDYAQLVAATSDQPGARRALIAGVGADMVCPRKPIEITRIGPATFANRLADADTRVELDECFAALVEAGRAGAREWADLARHATALGIPRPELHHLVSRRAALHRMNTRSAYEIVTTRSGTGIELLLEHLTWFAPFAWTATLRDRNTGTAHLLRVGPRPRAVHLVTSPGEPFMAGKTNSRAAARRTRAHFAQQATNPTTTPEVETALAGYVPKDVADAEWAEIADTFGYVVRRSAIRSRATFNKARAPLSGLLVWRLRNGKDVSVAAALTHVAIDEFLRLGAPHLSPKAFNDYSSRLRRLARNANPSPDAPARVSTSGRYLDVQAPLPEDEEQAIIAATLRRARYPECRGAVITVGVGGGGGADASVLRLLRPAHFTDLGDDGIVVDFPGSRPRQVMIRRPYEPLVRAALEGLRPNQSFFPNPGSHSAISHALDRAGYLDDVPHFTSATLRNTWLAWLLIQGLPLGVTLKVAGLTSARTLVSLLNYLEPIEVELPRLRGTAR